jgi:RNA polymerase sigma-70 factor (ECF subfamily)
MNGARPREPVNTEELFRNHASFVARFLSRLGVAPGDLDDAVQEVFLVVHRNGGYMPGPASPTGYLAAIAVRAAAAHRRRFRKSRDRRAETGPDETSSTGNDPARSLEVQESLGQLQDALETLEPNLRTTLVLAEIEGESCKAIAESMRIPVGTVYWRLHRARKTFRLALHERAMNDGASRESPPMGLAGAFLFGGSPAAALLHLARQQPVGAFDVATALERFRAFLRGAPSLPPWAPAAAAKAALAAGFGAAVPAALSGAVAIVVVGAAIPRWHAQAAPAVLASTLVTAPVRVQVASPALLAPAERAPVAAPPPAVEAAALTRPVVLAAPAHHMALAAPPVPAPPAEPPPAPPRDDMQGEMQEIEETAAAERLLATDPARALALVEGGEARYPSGYMREERRYVGIVALADLGRSDEARSRGEAFLRDYPGGPFAARVRALLAAK